MNEKIKCDRLILKSLSLKEMEQIQSGSQKFLADSVLSEVIMSAVSHKIKQMKRVPDEAHPWLNYWLAAKRENGYGIGLIGSKYLPDEEGYVELGYAVAKEYRGCGYMTEALEGFLDWLYQYPFCAGARLSICETNSASIKVAERCGFQLEKRKGGERIYRYKFFGESC
ncbi:MAG: GNAT family N-acetyltransferase [Eubacterium sp.]|mgnify:CR=1 FL=1|jgi:GNAT superfamily N-acetyltransferase|nr:GNAT family N-acetyltransferase [Eubacterium sp.]